MPRQLRGDAVRLQHVLASLVTYAITCTEAGHIDVTVTAAPVEDDLLALTFTVEDTGVGIPAEHLPTLFAHADATADRACDGRVGLATCREIVRAMGGDITVTSIPGTGSTFAFTVALPEAPTTCTDLAARDSTPVTPGGRARQGRGARRAATASSSCTGSGPPASASITSTSSRTTSRWRPDTSVVKPGSSTTS